MPEAAQLPQISPLMCSLRKVLSGAIMYWCLSAVSMAYLSSVVEKTATCSPQVAQKDVHRNFLLVFVAPVQFIRVCVDPRGVSDADVMHLWYRRFGHIMCGAWRRPTAHARCCNGLSDKYRPFLRGTGSRIPLLTLEVTAIPAHLAKQRR